METSVAYYFVFLMSQSLGLWWLISLLSLNSIFFSFDKIGLKVSFKINFLIKINSLAGVGDTHL